MALVPEETSAPGLVTLEGCANLFVRLLDRGSGGRRIGNGIQHDEVVDRAEVADSRHRNAG